MTDYIRQAIPARPAPKPEAPRHRDYEILSTRCVWGTQGERVSLALTDGEELSLIEGGVLRVAAPIERPVAAETEEIHVPVPAEVGAPARGFKKR